MNTPSRRAALQQLLASASLVAHQRTFAARPPAPGRAAARVRLQADPFTLGVASGSPRPNSVVLWTRLLPQPRLPGEGLPAGPVPVAWEWADDAGFTRGVRRGEVLAHPDRGHAVHVRVEGLPPGRSGHYRFRVGDATSPVGRSRTAPGPQDEVARLRMAVASCQNYQHGRYAAHRDLAAQDLDLVLFLGDYIYDNHRRGASRARNGAVPVEPHGIPGSLRHLQARPRAASGPRRAPVAADVGRP